ncbi:MAG: HDOD domain-containing protein [Burkholderiaceae bacterium]|nr:HDOD domain-containing protein [Burkholderiaceae bacterium]
MSSDTAGEFAFLESLTTELSSKDLLFPTSLSVTLKIRQALSDPDVPTERAARLMGAEPVLSAQILRLANSAAYNNGGASTTDLRVAVTRLGFGMVRNVALAVGMKQLVQTKSSAESPALLNGLWNRSIRVAALSFVMARKMTRLHPDTAMIAGLLHDVGKFYILARAHSFTDVFVDQSALWGIIDGWHLTIGAVILETWEVSEEIRIAVLEHRDLERKHRGPPDITDVVLAANILDAHHHIDREPIIHWDHLPPALILLGLNKEVGDALMVDAKEELDLIFQALS